MKQDRVLIIIVTIALGVMIIGFTTMMIFVSNHRGDGFISNQDEEEQSEEEIEGLIEKSPFVNGVNIYDEQKKQQSEPEAIQFVMVSEDEIDASIEDAALHETTVEAEYTNTVELLPSIFNRREIVSKDRVDQSVFKDSYATAQLKQMEFDDGFTASVPAHIYLYNVNREESNSFTIEIETNKSDKDIIKKYGWSTSNSSNVALSGVDGKTITVTRKKDHIGESTVNLLLTYYSGPKSTATKEMTIDVTVIDVEGKDTLKDIDGQPLYLDEEGTILATCDDYSKSAHFYGAIKTTGWQTIEGKTYYFDRNSLPVKGKQVIGSTLYDFDEYGILTSASLSGEKGIDVSKYQRDIDWEQVAASGISFAIIRCGYRGAVGAQLVEDPYFKQNIKGAKEAGVKVGVYFFTQAITETEARQEAQMAVALCEGYNLDLPIYIDSENATRGRANGLSAATRTATLKAFCETVEANGIRAGVYASKSWFYHQVNVEELEAYDIWCAQYNTECNYDRKKNMWQYTSNGQVAGIVGRVDMDIRY